MFEKAPIFTGSSVQRAEPELPSPLDPLLRETGHYIPSKALQDAVEVALLLGMPLILTGEPGTGKSTVASALAHERFGDRYLEMQIKSTSGRGDLLYRFDELARFRDAQPNRKPRRLLDYITFHAVGMGILHACDPQTPLLHSSSRDLDADDGFLDEVFGVDREKRVPVVADLLPYTRWTRPERWVVLLDEIDKAPRDTPNDLLQEFEQMAFVIPELELKVAPINSATRPVIIVTSNSEKSLPDAFLRRCAFHHIDFPESEELLLDIVVTRLNFQNVDKARLLDLLDLFIRFRAGFRRPPGVAELLYWIEGLERMLGGLVRGVAYIGEAISRLTPLVAKNYTDAASARKLITEWLTEDSDIELRWSRAGT